MPESSTIFGTMREVERQIRVFGAAFGARPTGVSWLRARAHELSQAGELVAVVVLWGPFSFSVRRVPLCAPVFAIRHPDGWLEKPPA